MSVLLYLLIFRWKSLLFTPILFSSSFSCSHDWSTDSLSLSSASSQTCIRTFFHSHIHSHLLIPPSMHDAIHTRVTLANRHSSLCPKIRSLFYCILLTHTHILLSCSQIRLSISQLLPSSHLYRSLGFRAPVLPLLSSSILHFLSSPSSG